MTLHLLSYNLVLAMKNADEHKKKLEDEIVAIMIASLEKQTITEEDMSIMSGYVLDHVDQVTNYQTTMAFLTDISTRWKIFEPLLQMEKSEMKDKIEDEVADGVLLLARHGKIENAIKLAQSMTNSQAKL